MCRLETGNKGGVGELGGGGGTIDLLHGPLRVQKRFREK